MQIGQGDIKIPATGNVTMDFTLVGLGAVNKSGAQVLTSPSAAPTTAVTGCCRRGLHRRHPLRHDHQLQRVDQRQHLAGRSNDRLEPSSRCPARAGDVTGSFTAVFDGETIPTVFDQETTTSLVAVLADARTDAANTMAFVMTQGEAVVAPTTTTARSRSSARTTSRRPTTAAAEPRSPTRDHHQRAGLAGCLTTSGWRAPLNRFGRGCSPIPPEHPRRA
jgi:hypothetical protein